MENKILMVDDDRELCEEIREVLEDRGLEVETVFDGQEAMDRIQRRAYGLVILDLKVPGCRGDEILARIKAEDKGRRVIVVTGSPLYSPLAKEEEKRKRQWNLDQADAVINKPFVIEDLLKTINDVLGKRL